MTGGLRRPTLVLAGVVAAVLVAGCGRADTDSTPTFSTSTSPTAASTSASSVSPSSSATEGQETPEAFIKRWADLERQMENSGISAAYRGITPQCKPCQATADQVDAFYAAGGFVSTGGRTVMSIKPLESGNGLRVFLVRVSVAPTRYKQSASGDVMTFPGGQSTYQVSLQHSGPNWLLADYTKTTS